MRGLSINKRGVSPIIATVLLIGMVIVIALILFLWFKSLRGETITKFGGQNVELVCGDVNFRAEYVGNRLVISNIGNVPIYEMNVEIRSAGSHRTEKIDASGDYGNWLDYGLDVGGVFTSDDLSQKFGSGSGVEGIVLTPILLGASEKGQKIHACDEDQNGYEIPLS